MKLTLKKLSMVVLPTLLVTEMVMAVPGAARPGAKLAPHETGNASGGKAAHQSAGNVHIHSRLTELEGVKTGSNNFLSRESLKNLRPEVEFSNLKALDEAITNPQNKSGISSINGLDAVIRSLSTDADVKLLTGLINTRKFELLNAFTESLSTQVKSTKQVELLGSGSTKEAIGEFETQLRTYLSRNWASISKTLQKEMTLDELMKALKECTA